MKKNHTFIIGLFTLVGFALFVVACVLFGGTSLFAQKIYFETYFNTSVQGLDVGGPVKFRGVQIGAVESIGFASTTYGEEVAQQATPDAEKMRALSYVRVLCSIDTKKHSDLSDERLQQMIDHGLCTSLALQGITGVVYINLDFDKDADLMMDTPPWTPETRHLPSKRSATEQLMSAAEKLADQLPKAIDTLTALGADLRQAIQSADIPTLSKDARELVASLNTQAKQLSKTIEALNPEALGKNLAAMADDLAATSKTLREALPTTTAKLDTTLDQATATLQDASATLQEATGAIKAAEGTLAKLNDTVTTATEATNFNDIGESLATLNRTTAALEALVNELRERPSRLIFDSDAE